MILAIAQETHERENASERLRRTADSFTGFDSEQLTLSFLVTHDTPGHTAAYASPDQMVADGGADAIPAVMHRENQGAAQRMKHRQGNPRVTLCKVRPKGSGNATMRLRRP